MAIGTLQQEAFTTSTEFNKQVNSIVVRQALDRSEALDSQDPAAAQLRQTYAQVVRDPARYGFTPALVAAASWAITFDAWAADPNAAEGTIFAAVNHVWTLLTGTP